MTNLADELERIAALMEADAARRESPLLQKSPTAATIRRAAEALRSLDAENQKLWGWFKDAAPVHTPHRYTR